MDTIGLARLFISPWLSSAALVIEGNNGGVAQASRSCATPDPACTCLSGGLRTTAACLHVRVSDFCVSSLHSLSYDSRCLLVVNQH